MNKSTIIGAVFGVGVATAVAGLAGYALMDEEPSSVATAEDSGQVRDAEHCYETQVERPVAPRDDKRIAGTAIGAVIGGAVGNDVGDSDVTTAAGAAVGAIAGRKAQEEFQENRTETVTEVRCD